MQTELERVVRDHIADLRRSAVVMSKYIQMDASAEEIRKAANELEAALQAQQPGAQAVGVIRENPDDIGLYADFDNMPPVGTKLYTQPPSIPEPSEEDVEAAARAIAQSDVDESGMSFDIHWTANAKVLRADARSALTTYTARLRERIGGGS